MVRFSLVRVVGSAVFLSLLIVNLAGAASSGETCYREGEILVRYRVEPLPEVERFAPDIPFSLSSSMDAGRPDSLCQIGKHFGLLSQRCLWPLDRSVGKDTGRAMPYASGVAGGESRSSVQTWLLKFDPERDLDEILKTYRRDPRVIHAEPNYIGRLCATPTDPLYAETAADLAMIGAEEAWNAQAGANEGIVVAVIDSGVEKNHPDLRDALDLVRSYNFVNNNNDIYDDLGHGTRVAGIIGACANNEEGIAGLAFGCTLLSLDVTDSEGEVSLANVISALNWAAAEGAQVVNMSLVFDVKSQLLEEACQAAYNAGILLVAAVGNEDRSDRPVYPASFGSVIGVGATRDGEQLRAPWSNFNGIETDLVELVAPGTTIFSTIPGSQYNGTYGTGTSFAAPMVAGTAALLGAKYPEMSAGAIRSHLRATSLPLGDWAGAGLLDAGAALNTAMTPQIHVSQVIVNDDPAYSAMNDGDGRLDEGETVQLSVRLANTGADAVDLQGTLSSLDTEILTSQTTSSWPFLPCNLGSSSERISSDTAIFDGLTYSAAAPTAKTVWFQLALSAHADTYQTSMTFSLKTENAFTPPIIIDTVTTWAADRTIVITSQTVVMEEAMLTIEPGATVRFGPAGGLEVRGGIEANGTVSEQIRFTAIEEGPGGGFSLESLPVSPNPRALAAGDVNHDGFKDILCITSDLGPNAPTEISCFLGSTFGFLSEHRIIVGSAASNNSTNLNISDLNGDGMDEVLCDGQTYDWQENDFIHTGTLSIEEFRSARDSFPNSTNGRWDDVTYVADVDGDHDNDIVTLAPSDQKMKIRRWNGTTLEPSVEVPIHISAVHVYIGDALNNGVNEIIVSNAMGTITIFSWQGNHAEQTLTIETNSFPRALSIVDIDMDGDNDLIVSHQVPGNILLFKWNGFTYEQDKPLAESMGLQEASSLLVTDVNNDRFLDVITSDLSLKKINLLLWDTKRFGMPKYQGITLNATVSRAGLAFCHFEYAPVQDNSDVSVFSDCLFRGSGSTWSYAAIPTTGTAVMLRCEAISNDAGGGIFAPGKTLDTCIAGKNAGNGLEGKDLVNCLAEDNAGVGMVAQSASGCQALNNNAGGIVTTGGVTGSSTHKNGGWGIQAGGAVENSSATHNRSGIMGLEATNCEAEWNQETGIQVSGSVTRSRAERNGMFGIQGGFPTDCVVVGNGFGLDLSSTGAAAMRCLIAENAYFGVNGGSIDSSVIHHNTGPGSMFAKSISNSWIVGNATTGVDSAESVTKSAVLRNRGIGILGRQSTPYTSILDSTIQGNAHSGVKRVTPMNGCNISGNAIKGGYDYEEDRLSTELMRADLSKNYWGSETTTLMNAHPWGTYYNIPRIFDFNDNTLMTEAKYEEHLTAAAPTASPDATAPAFLLSLNIAPGSDGVVGVGITTFTLTFSKEMQIDSSALLSVTFGSAAPYDRHIVVPARNSGWLSSTTWQGVFAVQSNTGDGLNRLCVRGALALDGFALPPDTAHTFIVDTSGEGGANNGMVLLHTTRGLKISWTAKGLPPDAQGFNIRRSQTGEPGSYQKINAEIVTGTEFYDETNGSSSTRSRTVAITYFYIVDMVDAHGHSIQWTPPFIGLFTPRTGLSGWMIF